MKRCKYCGCLLSLCHDGDICECCLDERGDIIPDSFRKEITE